MRNGGEKLVLEPIGLAQCFEFSGGPAQLRVAQRHADLLPDRGEGFQIGVGERPRAPDRKLDDADDRTAVGQRNGQSGTAARGPQRKLRIGIGGAQVDLGEHLRLSRCGDGGRQAGHAVSGCGNAQNVGRRFFDSSVCCEAQPLPVVIVQEEQSRIQIHDPHDTAE